VNSAWNGLGGGTRRITEYESPVVGREENGVERESRVRERAKRGRDRATSIAGGEKLT
jgi:hypothetical protein